MSNHYYSIKDVKVNHFSPIFPALNDQAAIRQFHFSVNDKSHLSMLAQYPADHELWSVLTFDDESGSSTSSPHLIISGAALVEMAKE